MSNLAARIAAHPKFAQHIHAQARAIIALREVERALMVYYAAKAPTRGWVDQLLGDEITWRCRRLGLDPDFLGDVLESAQDEIAVQTAEARAAFLINSSGPGA
jgi:hypothetical protein